MRKPNIGMLSKILENQSFNQDETEIYFVGDKITDVETGLNARGLGILIDNGENEEDVKEARVRNIKIAENLLEAANYILNNKKE
jgi:histidinol phosphatase-like enzyme